MRPAPEAAAPKQGTRRPIFLHFNHGFDRTREKYVSVTRFVTRKLSIAVAVMVVVVAATALIGGRLPTGFVPSEDQGYLFISAQLPDAASIQRTEAVCEQIEGILATTPGIAHFDAIAGFNILSLASSTDTALFFISLKPWDERKTKETSADGISSRSTSAFTGSPRRRCSRSPPRQSKASATRGASI